MTGFGSVFAWFGLAAPRPGKGFGGHVIRLCSAESNRVLYLFCPLRAFELTKGHESAIFLVLQERRTYPNKARSPWRQATFRSLGDADHIVRLLWFVAQEKIVLSLDFFGLCKSNPRLSSRNSSQAESNCRLPISRFLGSIFLGTAE